MPQQPWHSPARYGNGPATPPDNGSLSEPARRPAVRLTGRGAILSLFVLSFLGLILSDWLSLGMFGNATFVAACMVIACYAKRSDLLPVAVSPPLVFLIACVCAQVATSAGGTSAAEGTMVTLASSAPWLFAGTVLTVIIGLCRGLLGNIRELHRGLHGDPSTFSRDGGASAGDGPSDGPAPRR